MLRIDTTDALAALCKAYAAYPYITVDTEFMRERTYWAQLCLVQMARPGEGADAACIIDPLAGGIDLAPLYELMADTRVVKVFHAARQDIEIFHHMGAVIPAPLFDTQVAAMVCGYGEQVGYETLVRKIAKAEVDKSSRFTDWAKRPLSEKQLDYALADVTHLRGIYEALAARLEATGRAHWVAEEMAVLTTPATYEADLDQIWRRVKARTTNPKILAIVRELARWREINAQDRDVPRQKILKDEALVEIATAQPKTPEEIGALRLAQREIRKAEMAAEVLAAVAAGRACPPEMRPSVETPPPRREGSAAIADLLKVFLKARSEELGIASKILASASDLEALAGEDAPQIPALQGWRFEVFGRDACRVRDGQLALAAQPGGVRLVEVDP